MDSSQRRQLAGLLSSLVSQLTLLVILLFPSHTNNNNNNLDDHSLSVSLSPHSHTLLSLLHHFLSSSLSLLSRKRSLVPGPHPHPPKLARVNPARFDPARVDPARVDPARVDSVPGPTPNRVNSGDSVRFDSVRVKDPGEFGSLFRMTPGTFEWLTGLLEPLLECRDPVGFELEGMSAELRLGIGLNRLATGLGYCELAERFRVTARVARFCTKQLCRVLCTNFRFWAGFPNPTEIGSVCLGFEGLTGLPNCCGVIGCTRFELGDDSVAAQIVVDSSCRILNVVAGFRGSKSNVEILKSSTLYKDVENGTLLNGEHVNIGQVSVPQYLVADKGYPILPWLMTPFDHDDASIPGSNEEKFNACHGLITRVSVRKAIASLKSWGILSKPIEEEFRDGVAYIGACAILHNALLLRGDFSGLADTIADDMFQDHDFDTDPISTQGCAIRTALATKAKDLSETKS